MDLENAPEKTGYNIDNNNFRKIFRHLCIAARKNSAKEKKDKSFYEFEKKVISEKIDAVEKRYSGQDSWIKYKLNLKKELEAKPKTVVVRPKVKNSKNIEIEEIKRHVIELKKSYETLKKNKKVSKVKLKALKDRLEKLEKILKKYDRKY
jgi:hypothetical protein